MTPQDEGDAALRGQRVQRREVKAAERTLHYYEMLDIDPLLEGAIERGERPPYGAVPWSSAFAVARDLTTRDLGGRRVVDAGAGCGVVSLVAAALGAQVCALEVDPIARALLARAAGEQALSIDVRDFDLEGNEALPLADLFVFADVLYERPLALAIARRAVQALRAGAAVIVGDPGRGGRETFQLAMMDEEVDAEFHSVEIAVPGESETRRVGLCHLHPRCLTPRSDKSGSDTAAPDPPAPASEHGGAPAPGAPRA